MTTRSGYLYHATTPEKVISTVVQVEESPVLLRAFGLDSECNLEVYVGRQPNGGWALTGDILSSTLQSDLVIFKPGTYRVDTAGCTEGFLYFEELQAGYFDGMRSDSNVIMPRVENGLYVDYRTIKLGGQLTENTEIPLNTYTFTMTGDSVSYLFEDAQYSYVFDDGTFLGSQTVTPSSYTYTYNGEDKEYTDSSSINSSSVEYNTSGYDNISGAGFYIRGQAGGSSANSRLAAEHGSNLASVKWQADISAGTVSVECDIFRLSYGENKPSGIVTLVAGTATVNNTRVTDDSMIFLTVQELGTVATPKAVAITSRVDGASFTITSEDATDTSVVAWLIIQPVVVEG